MVINRPIAALRRKLRADEGFTLIEAVVAMVLVVIIFVGLMQTLAVSLRSLRENRFQQQATVLALEGVEFARSLSWDELAMTPEADDADPLVVGGTSLDGDPFGLPADEPLVEVTTVPGALAPYVTVETLDGQDFDVYSYVTDVEPGLRRVVVAVKWTSQTVEHLHHSSTLISEVSSS